MGTEQLHTDGIPLHLVIHLHKGAKDTLECNGGTVPAGGEGGHHFVSVETQCLKCLRGGLASVDGSDGELLHRVAHLVQVPGAGICALLEYVEHIVRREAQLTKLHGIFADAVNELA